MGWDGKGRGVAVGKGKVGVELDGEIMGKGKEQVSEELRVRSGL